VKTMMLSAVYVGASVICGFSGQHFGVAQGIASAGAPTFDVVSIKPILGNVSHGDCKYQTDRITCQSTLLELIEEAYAAKQFEVDGREWLKDEAVYSFRATMPAGTTKENARMMLQKALSDRFALQLHTETRPIQMYALLPGKQGLKLQVPDDPAHPKEIITPDGRKVRAAVQMSAGRFYASNLSLDFFAEIYVSQCVGTPVVNMTGATGEYKIDLQWMPTEDPAISYALMDPVFLVTAEKQLGLQLEKRTLPHKINVIDHASQAPTGD
jgi:uncharacterized protein (TIGR03435 family)